MNPLVVDLSHWDPAQDYAQVKAAGIVGVIYKATDDIDYQDPTYRDQKSRALAVGLKWGAYHYARSGNVTKQVNNFINFAQPDTDTLICLDWETNPSGRTMTSIEAKEWIAQVETRLVRPQQVVIYSGNVAKEALGSKVDVFFGLRRLWLAQYGTVANVQPSWKTYWLWQYTDGNVGPEPHSIPGVGNCDINHFDGTPDQLKAEWATGKAQPAPTPVARTVTITVDAPPDVRVVVQRTGESNAA